MHQPLKRFRTRAETSTCGPFRPSLWPSDIFVHETWVLATFKGNGPRRYESLPELLRMVGLRESDLVEIPPSGCFAAVRK